MHDDPPRTMSTTAPPHEPDTEAILTRRRFLVGLALGSVGATVGCGSTSDRSPVDPMGEGVDAAGDASVCLFDIQVCLTAPYDTTQELPQPCLGAPLEDTTSDAPTICLEPLPPDTYGDVPTVCLEAPLEDTLGDLPTPCLGAMPEDTFDELPQICLDQAIDI